MSFLALMAVAAAIAWLAGLALRRPMSVRDAMRFGAAAAFLFTGIDHFVSAGSRYVPMMPAFFGASALPLVWFTGAAEIAGAVGLLVPLRVYRRLGLPDLRRWAGIALAVMLGFLVIANVNVALTGSGVEGIRFGAWYFWLRPLFQPLIMLWVLYAADALPRSAGTGSAPPAVGAG